MKIKNSIHRAKFYEDITIYENNILLKKEYGIGEKTINDEILETLTDYGKKLLEIVPKTFIQNKNISENVASELLKIFVTLYSNRGYIEKETDIKNKDSSFILVPLESILSLTTEIIRFYLYYELYMSFDNLNEHTDLIKENMNLLVDNFNFQNFSQMYLLGIIKNELDKYKKQVDFEFDFNYNGCLGNIANPGFNIVSNNLYVLGLYILSDKLFIEDRKKYIQCYICKDIVLRTNDSQKYCPTCSKIVNYSENTNNNKLEIIKELNTYKDKVHLARDYERKLLVYYCSLINKGNSRELLNTKKKDLKDFLETVKEQYSKEQNQ